MNVCFCSGPRNGEPACRCRMANYHSIGGRWVEMIDHGPVEEDWTRKIKSDRLRRKLQDITGQRNAFSEDIIR